MPSHEFVAGNHNRYVEGENTYADRQAHGEVKHDGYAADAAAEQVMGDEKGIHADGYDETADEGGNIGNCQLFQRCVLCCFHVLCSCKNAERIVK